MSQDDVRQEVGEAKHTDVHCSVCKRLHNETDPCPLRVARCIISGYSRQMGTIGSLTEADKQWVVDNPTFNLVDLLEETLATLM